MKIVVNEKELEILYCALHFYTMMFGLSPYACVDKHILRNSTYDRYKEADALCSRIEEYYYMEND